MPQIYLGGAIDAIVCILLLLLIVAVVRKYVAQEYRRSMWVGFLIVSMLIFVSLTLGNSSSFIINLAPHSQIDRSGVDKQQQDYERRHSAPEQK